MLVLIRHPPVALPAGTCYGRLDVELSPYTDLADIVGRLTTFPKFVLWSSPSVRCRVVAEAIAAAVGVVVRLDSRLLELDFGVWEGLPWSDVPRAELDRWAACPASFAPPGGESGASLVARVAELYGSLEQLRGAHVVVSHGGPLRLLAALAAGRRIDLLARPPDLGSVQFIVRSRTNASDDDECDALGENRDGAEDIAGVTADLPSGERGHARSGNCSPKDASQRGMEAKQP